MKAVSFEQKYFPTRIQNGQIVKKEGSYQTFKVSENVSSIYPFTGVTGGCAPPEQENKPGKKSEMQETGNPSKGRPSR